MFCLCRQPNVRKYLRSGEYKQNLCSYDRLSFGWYDRSISICPRHPEMLLGSRQTVSSELTPREFHPNCRSDRAALIACDVFFTLGLWLDGSTIILFVGHSEIGSCPIFRVGKDWLTTFHRSLPFGRSWRTAAHAYAHHNHKEKVFGELVFICQGAIPFSPHKGKQGKSFLSSHPVARGNIQFSPLLKKLF